MSPQYPWYTPYQFAGNKPVQAIDLDGLEEWVRTVDFTENVEKPKIAIVFNENATPLEKGIHEIHKYPGASYQSVTYDITIPQVAIKRSSAPHFNSSDYSIRDEHTTILDLDLETDKTGRRGALLDEYLGQTGPTNSLFLENHSITQGVKEMKEVDRLRFLVYQKYGGDIPADGSYTEFAGSFGLTGLLETGANLPGQFVGSLTGDVFADAKGENLIFVISDAKSRKSLLLRLGDEPEREDASWGGNTYQKYFWIEPVDPNFYNQEKNRRDKNGYIKEETTPGEKLARPFEGD